MFARSIMFVLFVLGCAVLGFGCQQANVAEPPVTAESQVDDVTVAVTDDTVLVAPQAEACDESACSTLCSRTGFCESSCASGACRCRQRRPCP